jgi:chromosome partitioning protein
MLCVTLASGKGGACKSTSALAVAGILAQHYRVGLLDLDPEAFATTMGLGQAEAADPLSAEPIVIKHPLLARGTLTLFPGGEPIDQATRAQIAAHIQRARRAVDILIIDTPPDRRRPTVLEALRAASVVVVPLPAEFQMLSGLEKLRATAEAVGSTAPIRALLSRWEPKTLLAQDVQRAMVTRFPGMAISAAIPKDQRAAEAPAAGLPVTLYAPRSAASAAFRIATCEIAASGGLRIPKEFL